MFLLSPKNVLYTAIVGFFYAFLCAQNSQDAEMWPMEERSDGDTTMLAFTELIESSQNSVVGIYVPPRDFIGLATVVGDGSYLLTKASELLEQDLPVEECVIRNARYRSGEIELVGIDHTNDLALLKTDMENLTPVNWAPEDPKLGDWNFSFTDRLRRATSGVISANSRPISSIGSFLGVVMSADEERNNLPIVTEISPGSAAELAGIKEGDYLLGINNITYDSIEEFATALQQFTPGQLIQVLVERSEKIYSTNLVLGYRSSLESEQSSNSIIAGKVSLRLSGFGRIYQHTALLTPSMMGGPLLDLEGNCLGINIARLDRTTTFTLTPEQVLLSLQRINEETTLEEFLLEMLAEWEDNAVEISGNE